MGVIVSCVLCVVGGAWRPWVGGCTCVCVGVLSIVFVCCSRRTNWSVLPADDGPAHDSSCFPLAFYPHVFASFATSRRSSKLALWDKGRGRSVSGWSSVPPVCRKPGPVLRSAHNPPPCTPQIKPPISSRSTAPTPGKRARLITYKIGRYLIAGQ